MDPAKSRSGTRAENESMANRESAMTTDNFALGEELEELLREEERMAARRANARPSMAPRGSRARLETPVEEVPFADFTEQSPSTEGPEPRWTSNTDSEGGHSAHSTARFGVPSERAPQFPARIYAVPGYNDSSENVLTWASGSPSSIFTQRERAPTGSSVPSLFAPNPVGTFAGLPPDMALAALPATHVEHAPFRPTAQALRRQGSYFAFPPPIPSAAGPRQTSTSSTTLGRTAPVIGEPGYTMRYTREELLLWREEDSEPLHAAAAATTPAPRSQFDWEEPTSVGCFGGVLGCFGKLWCHQSGR
ncbi:hypothetical protein DFH27DRAFT_304931 [Peziza echinospora]|nr:hypothetical protein DFH27DRAFT_304931 [Peziza echinospora]